MSKKKPKYYVVWVGAKPGVYSDWDSCKAQITAFPGAKYKSFPTREEALMAFSKGAAAFLNKKSDKPKPKNRSSSSNIIQNSISVDAACSGNPGTMEYQGVKTDTGEQIFHQGPFHDGTNNIGEFLALVHALALLKRKGMPNFPIYSDSRTAMAWVRKRKCNSKLKVTSRNTIIFEMINKAESWLNDNKVTNPILKWETESWGEIPADFGRK